MLFDALVTLARATLESRSVGHPHAAAAGCNEPFGRQLLDDGVDRGALYSEQGGKRFLGELELVAGPILRAEQPARAALGDRVERVTDDRPHDLGQQLVR